MSNIGFFAGSFDPITIAHQDIIFQSCKLFDKVYIAISQHPQKKSWLTSGQRAELAKLACQDFDNIEIIVCNELTVDAAKRYGANFLIRGVRNAADVNYELDLARNNHFLDEQLRTVFFNSSTECLHISSSLVRELYMYKKSIDKLISPIVLRKLTEYKS